MLIMRSGNHHTNPFGGCHKGGVTFPRLGSGFPCAQWHRGLFAGKRAPARRTDRCRFSQIIRDKFALREIFVAPGCGPDPGSAISLTGANLLLASMDFNPQGGRHVTEPRSAGCRAGLISAQINIGEGPIIPPFGKASETRSQNAPTMQKPHPSALYRRIATIAYCEPTGTLYKNCHQPVAAQNNLKPACEVNYERSDLSQIQQVLCRLIRPTLPLVIEQTSPNAGLVD